MRFLLSCLALLASLAVLPSAAQELSRPAGPPILTVSGALGVTNMGATAVFDREMLEALPSVSFTTSTIWTEGPQTFTGVPLSALLQAVDAQGGTAAATAINDYAVDIPVDTITDAFPIIAYLSNGEPMSLRDKGPLWVVYPYDSDPTYQSEVVYSRSIWQLDRIVITP